jgi:hypothetical protein
MPAMVRQSSGPPPQYAPLAYGTEGGYRELLETAGKVVVLAASLRYLHAAYRVWPLTLSNVFNPFRWGTLFSPKRWYETLTSLARSLAFLVGLLVYCRLQDGDVFGFLLKRLTPNLLPGAGTLVSVGLLLSDAVQCVGLAPGAAAVGLAVGLSHVAPPS